MDKRPLQKHSESLRIQAFESLEGFKMYYAIGTSVSSLHRESTDSLIGMTMVSPHYNCTFGKSLFQFQYVANLISSKLNIDTIKKHVIKKLAIYILVKGVKLKNDFPNCSSSSSSPSCLIRHA